MSLPAYFPNAVAVTPSDTTTYDPPLKALYIGGAGAVAVRMKGGNNVTFSGALAGSFLWLECDRVLATGTVATNIVGLR